MIRLPRGTPSQLLQLTLTLFLLGSLAACSTLGSPSGGPTPSPSDVPAATQTATTTATLAPSPTLTSPPAPTAVPSATPTPQPVILSPAVMGQIREDAALAHNLDGLILSLAWDPTGSLLAVGRDEDILVFQQPGLQPVTQLPVGSLTAGLAFDPLLPNHLVSGSNDGQIRLWDVADGRVLQTLDAYPKGVTQIAFQPGGELLASAGNGALVYLWDLQSGEQVDSLIGGAFAVPDLAFVPDGSRIVSVDGGVIRVREVATGRLIYSLRAGESVPAIAVSPDGRSVAASRRPGALQLWDLETGELIWEQAVRPDSTAWTLAFNPAGDLLASGWRDGSLCWLDPRQPEGTICQPAHTRPVGVVLFSPDGRSMLSGGYDGWLRFWAATP